MILLPALNRESFCLRTLAGCKRLSKARACGNRTAGGGLYSLTLLTNHGQTSALWGMHAQALT